jgi:hypothetical protein
MTTCPEHLRPHLATLTVRVAVAARDREEAERAAAALFAPLDPLHCAGRALFVSALPLRTPRGEPQEVQAVALPNGGVRALPAPRVKRLAGGEDAP